MRILHKLLTFIVALGLLTFSVLTQIACAPDKAESRTTISIDDVEKLTNKLQDLEFKCTSLESQLADLDGRVDTLELR